MLAPGIAYLTSDAEITSPFVQSFRVLEELPTDLKALRRALREREIGTLEIKKRGVDVDPATFRTQLKLKVRARDAHPHARGTSRIALLAERVTG
jgi:hypothetical protein